MSSSKYHLESLERRLLFSAYNWQNVNIPAGGFVDGIFYDAHNQNVMYARTDVGGLYKSVNDGGNWSQMLNWVGGNTSGSGNGTQYQEFGVLSFAIDPENSNNLYAMVGLYSGTNGDVLYSTNAGATWNTTPLSFYVGGNMDGRGAGERIAVDPYDSNIIFMGSNANGLWESTNAGQSFSQVSSFSSSASINLVLFDPNGGTAGHVTQEIFVGQESTASGTNLFKTTSGGTSWTEVTGTGAAPTTWMPNRAAMASDGNLYLAYANDQAPTEPDNGGVFRYNTSTGIWANISPVVPQVTEGSADYFGYSGLALDPNSPTTIVVTSLDRYNYNDAIWRTTNANASSPSWVALYESNGYNGYNTTRNTTNAPYMASGGDGIGNWSTDVAINPFNSAQIMHNYGGGIWATNNGNSTSTLTAPNSWYFPDTGIGMTAVLSLAAAKGGTPLYSGMGDVGGFAFTSVSFSPTQGNVYANGGNGSSVDSAGLVPLDAALVGNMGTTDGFYTTNGTTFTAFAANPGGSSPYSNGTVAESANGSTIVWAPSGQAAYYSTNDGASWTLSTLGASGALPTGGTILSDQVNPNYFYYWIENSSDNGWTIYISSDGGHTFNASVGGSIGTGNSSVAVDPNVAGQLWLSSYIGLYESTDFGASFNHVGSWSTGVTSLALGAPAPGQSLPAIYIYGTPGGDSFEGIYRSDDGGNTWLLLNSVSQQWGGTGPLAADPSIFGRVYAGAGGIVMGNPATSLPTNWLDQDINQPGNPGWATNSTTLSTGTTVNQWDIVGGGAGFSSSPISISSLSRTGGVATAITTTAKGLQVGQTITISGATNSAYDGTFVVTALYDTVAGLNNDIGAATEFTFAIASGADTASGTITATLNDQFNFAYQSLTGSNAISAQIKSVTNADAGGGTPQAGVMYRASTNPTDPFLAVVQPSSGSVVLEYRTTTGGSITTQTVSGIAVGSEYVKIIRNGNSFTGFYSPSGTTWTQIGSSVSIIAMPATANAGLMTTASYNPQLTDATFSNVVVTTGPSVATAASANPNSLTGGSTLLSVLGADASGESNLTYTWSTTGTPPAPVNFSANGTNAAKNTTATFTATGTYNFLVTITDAGGLSVTSSVTVIVNPPAWLGSGSVAAWNPSAQTLTVTGATSIIADPGSDEPIIQAATASAQITVNPASGTQIHVGGISLTNGARLTITPFSGARSSTNYRVVVVGVTGASVAPTFVIDSASTFDLANSDMIVHTGNLSTIWSLVTNGFSGPGGYWNGTGITSSSARANATKLTTLGVISNNNGNSALYSSFDNQPAVPTDVLVKYTFYGDANFDGKVDGSDYSLIDSGYLTHATGWPNGDFNYDGVVNGSDYTLIDNAFNTQGARLAASIASPNAALAQANVKNSKALMQRRRAVAVPIILNTTTAIALPQEREGNIEIELTEKDKLDNLTSATTVGSDRITAGESSQSE